MRAALVAMVVVGTASARAGGPGELALADERASWLDGRIAVRLPSSAERGDVDAYVDWDGTRAIVTVRDLGRMAPSELAAVAARDARDGGLDCPRLVRAAVAAPAIVYAVTAQEPRRIAGRRIAFALYVLAADSRASALELATDSDDLAPWTRLGERIAATLVVSVPGSAASAAPAVRPKRSELPRICESEPGHRRAPADAEPVARGDAYWYVWSERSGAHAEYLFGASHIVCTARTRAALLLALAIGAP